MDSIHQHSLITPTTCFTVACVAFSFLAVSTVWRNHNSTSQQDRRRDANPIEAEERRPKAVRRRAVDSLYVQPGELDFSKYANNDEPDSVSRSPEDVLSDMIALSASLAQQLRSYQRTAGTRVTISSLLGELSVLTTSFCRIQQLYDNGHISLKQGGAVAACFGTCTSSLQDTFSVLQFELSNPKHSEDDAVHLALQQVRDQRTAIDFLLESGASSALPPTPPCDSEIETSLKHASAAASSSSNLIPSTAAPTGLTPMVDAKAWIEPPPEYSPPGPGSMHLLQAEKTEAKASSPVAPEQEFAISEDQSSGLDSDGDELYHAISNNDLDEVVALLNQGADPNKTFGDLNRTPLHQAAHMNHTTSISLLLRNGALITLPDASGDTALHLAAWAGNVEAISTLLAHGADVDYLSGRDGYSALWCAVSAHHIDAARLLLKHGARVSLRSEGSGMQLLHQAAVTGQGAMCELLLERGALVDSLDAESQTALHYAAATGSVSCAQVLLRAGASVGVKQGQGLTPAHWAAHKDHTDVLALLLQYGAEVDPVAKQGATPLHLSANRGHYSVVKLLLEKGARRGKKAIWDGVEGTPAEMAKAKGHVRVAKVIDSWRRPKS